MISFYFSKRCLLFISFCTVCRASARWMPLHLFFGHGLLFWSMLANFDCIFIVFGVVDVFYFLSLLVRVCVYHLSFGYTLLYMEYVLWLIYFVFGKCLHIVLLFLCVVARHGECCCRLIYSCSLGTACSFERCLPTSIAYCSDAVRFRWLGACSFEQCLHT